MKPTPIYIIVLAILLLAGCGEKSQPVQQQSQNQPQSQQAAPPPPAAKAVPWPFISAEQTAGQLAENLTGKNFLLVFDGSGSMLKSNCAAGSRKIDVAKKAVTAWAKSVPANANLGLYAFHNQGTLTLPLATGNRKAFMAAINQIVAGGNTPLAQAMAYAYDAFTQQGRRQLGYGEYTIVVVTDGIANSIPALQKIVNRILKQSPINIYSIGFCIGEQHSLNQPGRTIYKAADNPQELRQGLQDVLAESESFDAKEFEEHE